MQLMSEWSGHWSERKTGQLGKPPPASKLTLSTCSTAVTFSYLITPLFLSSSFFFLVQNFFELQEKLVLLLL